MALLCFLNYANSALLVLGPSIVGGNGPSAGDPGGNLPLSTLVGAIAIGTWPTDYGSGAPYNQGGRAYFSFSQPFEFGAGTDFSIQVQGSGNLGTSAEFYFFMGTTMVGSYSVNNLGNNGLYSYDIPLDGNLANTIVILNASSRVNQASLTYRNNPDIRITDAGVAYPVLGPAALESNWSVIDASIVPEPSSLSLLVLGGLVVALRRRR